MGELAMDTGWLVGLAGLALALVQLWLGERRQRFDNTMRLIERLQESYAREARFAVADLITKAGPNHNFDLLTQSERAALASVSSLFGFAGALLRRKRISREVLLDSWSNSIVVNFEKLKPYKEWRSKRFDGSSGSSWTHFEWIAGQAERHLAATRKRQAQS